MTARFATQSLIISKPTREEVVEDTSFTVDKPIVVRAAKEAKLRVQLEDVLQTPEDWPDVRELVRESMPTDLVKDNPRDVPEYKVQPSRKKSKSPVKRKKSVKRPTTKKKKRRPTKKTKTSRRR